MPRVVEPNDRYTKMDLEQLKKEAERQKEYLTEVKMKRNFIQQERVIITF